MASVELNFVSCQYQKQHFPSPSYYEIQQNHPQPQPQPQHHDYRQQSHSSNQDFSPSPAPFDFEKFNQQAKQLQAQLHYFNQQQTKHIQQQINSVHQDGSQPQFDFAVNGNYSDLEKASEQFVNLGNLVGKQNVPPKVIKITKTLAVKQPVPVPYPVPVVKIVKEQVPTYHDFTHPSTTEKPSQPSSYFNYSSYINSKYPTPTAAGPSDEYHQHYHHQQQQQLSAPSSDEFDTEPFYVTTPQKETIKIVPVPYYVDEHGNKHEVSSSHEPSHETSSHDAQYTGERFYPNQQSSSQSSDGSGKFQTFTFSHHPPTYNSNPHQTQYSHEVPQEKYYYTHDSANSASSENPQNFANAEQNNEQQQYRYKYVSYE